MKKILSLMLAVVMVTSLFLSGCSNEAKEPGTSKSEASGEKPAPTTGALPFVELSYYIVGTPQPDLQNVNDELNKLLLEKINAKVTINLLDWGAYDQKMSVMIASGEEFDACFTAPWINNYSFNVNRGAYLPLDELLNQYMPLTKASMSPEIWDAARIGGKIYGVINQQIMARQSVLAFRKSAADRYEFDTTSVKKLADVEPYLKAVKENEPNATQIVMPYGIGVLFPLFDFEDIGDSGVGVISSTDTKVFNQFETEIFKEHALLMKSWYDKGYFAPDVLTSVQDQSRTFLRIPGTYKPGVETEEEAFFGEAVYVTPIGQTQLITSGVIATMTAISSTSKNPERTAMFLELTNNDKDVYNMLVFGVNGVHYNKVGDNRIELVENSGYFPNIAWELGNQFNAYILPGQSDDVWEETKKLNDSAKPSVLMGFSFDVEPVRSELANCNAVSLEYMAPLLAGVVPNVEAYLDEFNAKLKQAGVEKVIAEKQKQIDEFLANK